mmetsp:Transcript_46833/g.118660  ORF Transcript_46833/g.118660 Transcript_46833/m.118660 type:complete len:127 (-) Transcript_46833:274-654(-)
MERRRTRNSQKGFSPLKALGSLLAFFAQLEMFFMRIGVISIVRDPVIVSLLLLVLVVQPIVATFLAVASMVRRNIRSLCADDNLKEERLSQPQGGCSRRRCRRQSEGSLATSLVGPQVPSSHARNS